MHRDHRTTVPLAPASDCQRPAGSGSACPSQNPLSPPFHRLPHDFFRLSLPGRGCCF